MTSLGPRELRRKRLQVTDLFGARGTLVEMCGDFAAANDPETTVDKRVNVRLGDVIVAASDRLAKRCLPGRDIAPVFDPAATLAALREMIGERYQHGDRHLLSAESVDIDVRDVSGGYVRHSRASR
jgi:hypothetical protein